MTVVTTDVAFGVLGEVRAVVGGEEVTELGGPQSRALLAGLVVAGGRVVGVEQLVDAVWAGQPPSSVAGTLHAYVSRLRKALGPAGPVLERRGQGYRLAVPETAFDWWCFEDLAEQGRAALLAGDAAAARELLVRAEALWRGEPLAGLGERPFATGVVARLHERRVAATGDRHEAELRLGRHAALLGELAEAVQERPLDEARWGRLALARYRSGQQAEALRALADARRTLVDELGVEPGPALRTLELQVLRQDPALDAPAAPVAVVPAPRRPDPARPGGSLVGRDVELAVLLSVLEEASTSARLGVVEGEPGIGKTRLLEELAAVAGRRGALVLWGRSHESGAAPAFWPWLRVLRALRDVDPDHTEPGLAALLDARAADVSPVGVFTAMEGVASALRRAAADRPVVVLLDDLQWADPASLRLLAFLATHLGDEPVLVVGTVREGADRRADELTTALAAVARRRGSRRLRLHGLDERATAALVQQTTSGRADDSAVRRIHARAEGNPFFTEQLAQLLHDGADPDAPVPAGVSDVVRQRLAGLPPETRDLLQLCAVMGREVELAVLPTAASRSVQACLRDLEPAVAQRMLVEVVDRPGTLHFAHALVREVLVEDLSSVRRLSLHLQVADALETAGADDDHAELLAEHLWAAAPLGVTARAAGSAQRAADVAIRRFALRSAADLLARAADLHRAAGPAQVAQELDAVLRLTSVRRALDGFRGAADVHERAEELARRAGDAVAQRELMWARWAAAVTACDFATAEPIAQHLHARAQVTDDPVERRLGLHVWAIQCWHHGRLLESAAAFEAGERVPAPEVDERGDTLLSFERERLLVDRAFPPIVHEDLGDVERARERLDRLAEGLDPYGAALVRTFSCSPAAGAGDHVRVAERARPVVESDTEQLLSFWGGRLRMQLGWVDVLEGRVDDGVALFEVGHAVYSGAGLHTGTPALLANLSTALLQQGRTDQAAAYCARARAELDGYGEGWPVPVVLLAEAELAAARGEDAAPLFAAAAERARSMAAAGMLRRIETAAAAHR